MGTPIAEAIPTADPETPCTIRPGVGCSGIIVKPTDDGFLVGASGSEEGDGGSTTPGYEAGDIPSSPQAFLYGAQYLCDLVNRQIAVPFGLPFVEGVECAERQDVNDLIGEFYEVFASLPLESPPLNHQPRGDWALVNYDFIVYTDPEPQLLTAELRGQTVEVLATPTLYEWDFGNGDVLSTSYPGQPYPNQTITHTYAKRCPGVTLTLTTSWSGQVRLEGSMPGYRFQAW